MLIWFSRTNMEIDILIEEGVESRLEAAWLRGIAEGVLVAQDVSPEAAMGLVIASQERVQERNRSVLG